MSFLKNWLLPLGLVLLTLVPVMAGIIRFNEIGNGGPITEENRRFFSEPWIFRIHIFSSSIFGLFGALQFSPKFRAHYPKWHRFSGRILILAAGISAITGIYLTIVFPRLETDGPTLYYIRLVVGIVMITSLINAVLAIRRFDFKSHGAWMIRCYAIGLGAGTQAITHLPWLILYGQLLTGLIRDGAMGAGWLINYLIAEYLVRRGKMTNVKE